MTEIAGLPDDPPMKVKVTVFAVAFLLMLVMGLLVFAPAHDLELGVEVSVNAVFPVPVHAQLARLMLP